MPAAELLLKSVARLLRPLVRLMIQSGVGFPAFSDMVRGLYVDVAQTMVKPGDLTDSRLHVMTGVHRKEIRRLRLEAGDRAEIPPVVSIGSQIVARWIGSADTTDEKGHPRPLPRSPSPDGGPSFEALVRSITTDIRPRAVLDDWTSQGLIAVSADDIVTLQETAFIPRENDEAQLYYFARNLHDHVASAAANVAATGKAPFLDRSVHYNHLSQEAAHALEQISREAAQKLLMEINRHAMLLAEADEAKRATTSGTAQPSATHRVNLGVYLFSADDNEAPKP